MPPLATVPTAEALTGALTLLAAALVGSVAWRRPHERRVWRVAAIALALLAVPAPERVSADRDELAYAVHAATAVVAYGLLLRAHLWAVQQRVRASAARSWLDVAGGLATILAIACAVALRPLQQVLGSSEVEVALVLAQPSAALLMAGLALVGTALSGGVRDRRMQVVGVAVVLLWAGEVLELVVFTWSAQTTVALPAAQSLVSAAGAALLAVSAVLRTPRRAPRVDEGGLAILVGPVTSLGVAGLVVGWDHAVGLPTAAVACALVALAFSAMKVVAVFTQVTGLTAMRRAAMTDDLTGLGNRRSLAAQLGAVDDGEQLALTVIDLDRFKEVNDVLGHDAGDRLLGLVAARLVEDCPADELVVRHGGDEFALVHRGRTAAEAAQRAAEVVAIIGAPFQLGAHEVCVAASAGVAAAPEHAVTGEALMRMADSAMYRAKASGGGVLLYDQEVDAARRREVDLLADLRIALRRDELTVHFQPQLSGVDGRMVGVEALVRWPHAERGMLPPIEFLELAERHGLMSSLTEQVLRHALVGVVGFRAQHPVRLSVNISASSLLDPALVSTVASLLMEHGVDPSDLLLEITETQLMLDAEVTRRVVDSLVELGVGVSIDDYGTGYSSLAYLKDLPASELKLDGSFTAQVTSDERVVSIVRTTVDLAHSLGLRLVAEGVEDEETLHRLQALGVDVTQGYFHSRPLDAAALARWATARRADQHAATAS